MTFRQMVLMNDCIDRGETIEGVTEFAVDLFKAYRPYEKVERLSGIIYKFNTHFTDTVVQSFVDDTVKELSIREKSFLRLFIDWQNFLLADPENPIEVTLTSSVPSVGTITKTVTWGANAGNSGTATFTAVAQGITQITASTPGFTPATSAPISVNP